MQRFKISIFAAIVAIVLCGTQVWAEELVKPEALSLDDCIAIALKSQTDIITGKNNIVISNGRLDQKTSGYLPQISIRNNAFVVGVKGVLNQSTTGTALTVSQNIYDGGLREANVAGARYNLSRSRTELDRTKQTVVFNITSAYYEVLRRKHLADVSESNVKYNQSLRKQIEVQAELGEAAKVDVLPIEAQLANAEVDYLSAQNAVRISLLNLQNAMGLTPSTFFDIKEADAPKDIALEPIENQLNYAMASRPDLKGSEVGVGAARASTRAAKISLYPRPIISADYQRSISGGFTKESSQIVGGVAFDIFTGGANRAAYREARASQSNADENKKQLIRDIKTQIEEATLNLISAKLRVTASEASLLASKKNYEVQLEKYNQGLAITLDILNAQVQLITSQSNAVQAKYDYYSAIAQMNYALGGDGVYNGK